MAGTANTDGRGIAILMDINHAIVAVARKRAAAAAPAGMPLAPAAFAGRPRAAAARDRGSPAVA
jgi:hypothetical protein